MQKSSSLLLYSPGPFVTFMISRVNRWEWAWQNKKKRHKKSRNLEVCPLHFQSHRNWEDDKTLPTTPGPDSEEVPKKEALNLIRLFWRWGFPYISLNYNNAAYIGPVRIPPFGCLPEIFDARRMPSQAAGMRSGDFFRDFRWVWWLTWVRCDGKIRAPKKWRSTVYSPEN